MVPAPTCPVSYDTQSLSLDRLFTPVTDSLFCAQNIIFHCRSLGMWLPTIYSAKETDFRTGKGRTSISNKELKPQEKVSWTGR